MQYVTSDQNCRRCHKPLGPEPEVKPAEPPITIDSPPVNNYKHMAGIDKALADVLKVLRLSMGLSQRDMGARLGINRRHVSRFEGGRTTPNITSLFRIAKKLGVSVSFLMLMAEGALES